MELSTKTVSLWSHLNRPEILRSFLNPLYEPNNRVIWPSVAPMSLVLTFKILNFYTHGYRMFDSFPVEELVILLIFQISYNLNDYSYFLHYNFEICFTHIVGFI